MATTNDRARRRLASLQKQLKSARTGTAQRRIKAAIKLLHSDQAARKAGTATSNERRGAAVKARSQSASTTYRKVGKTTVARRKPAKRVLPKPTPPKPKSATKITKPLPPTVNRNKPKNLMSDRRGTNVPQAEQRKFQKEQELKAKSKKAHGAGKEAATIRAGAAMANRAAAKRKAAHQAKPGVRLATAAKRTVARGVAAVKAQAAKNAAAKRAKTARNRAVAKKVVGGAKRLISRGVSKVKAQAAKNAADKKRKAAANKKKARGLYNKLKAKAPSLFRKRKRK